jgi:hypothetical protein
VTPKTWIKRGGIAVVGVIAFLGINNLLGAAIWDKLNPHIPFIGDSGPPGLIDALDGALADAHNGRKALQDMLKRVEDCKTTPSAASADARRIQANLRKSLADALANISTDGVQHGDRLKAEFALAMKTSARADGDYADWADSVPSPQFSHNSLGQCGPTVSGADQRFQQAFAHDSDDATTFKKQFIDLYNPIAKQYDLKQWSEWEF